MIRMHLPMDRKYRTGIHRHLRDQEKILVLEISLAQRTVPMRQMMLTQEMVTLVQMLTPVQMTALMQEMILSREKPMTGQTCPARKVMPRQGQILL